MGAVRGLAAALLLLAWTGAAQAQLFGGDSEARKRIEEVRTDLLLKMQDLEQKLDQRMKALESTSVDRRSIIDLAGQLDALRADLARSRGQIEVLLHDMEVAEKRQKDLYVDIDTRLRKLEQVREQAAQTPPAEAGPSEEEKRTYETALNHFKLGNYSAAIDLLQQMLQKYPNGKLAPNAQYWIGMGYSGRRDYRSAIANLQKVIANWPTDPKAADAMLSIASAQEATGDVRSAQATLKDVLAKYPGSTAADQARLRLQQSVKR
jgi:tol-pal system protein YbgF